MIKPIVDYEQFPNRDLMPLSEEQLNEHEKYKSWVNETISTFHKTEKQIVPSGDDGRKKTFYKLVRSGHVFELYSYQKGIKYGKGIDTKLYCEDDPIPLERLELEEEKKEGETKEQIKLRNKTKTRNMIRRLCLANFNSRSKFITLTFRDTKEFDIKSIPDTNKVFKKFIQRMRYKYGDFKYLAVIEFQDKYDRGAVHYHMLSDLPYIPNKELREIWGQGNIRINKINDVDNVGAYVSAYINKDINDTRLDGKKVYNYSKNLIKPMEYRGADVARILKMFGLHKKNAVFASSYTNEYCGLVQYQEYNLKR